jgi:hypothetical protein
MGVGHEMEQGPIVENTVPMQSVCSLVDAHGNL